MPTADDKKCYRLLLKSVDAITQSGGINNFQNVTYNLAGLPQHIIDEIIQSPEIEVKCAWFKIYNYPASSVPFMITLPGLSHTKTWSSTKKTGTDYLVYGEFSYELFDWEGIPGIFTSDLSFLRDRSLTVKFVDPVTENELANTAFTSNAVNYVLSLLIVY